MDNAVSAVFSSRDDVSEQGMARYMPPIFSTSLSGNLRLVHESGKGN
jgi:hypothetical protein